MNEVDVVSAVFFVAVPFVGAGMFQWQAVRWRATDPAKAAASSTIAKALGLWVPWIVVPLAIEPVLGGAILDGGLHPRSNPWEFASVVAMLIVYARFAIWLFLEDGGLFVSEHFDLIDKRLPAPSPLVAKLVITAMMLGGISSIVLSWLADR